MFARSASSGSGIFWISFVTAPAEFVRKRRNGASPDEEGLLLRNQGDVTLTVASLRSSVIILLVLPITGVQCLLTGLFGATYGIEDWLWYLLSILAVLLLALLVRELGWPNLMVPDELRGVPGLMAVRLRQLRDRRRESSASEE